MYDFDISRWFSGKSLQIRGIYAKFLLDCTEKKTLVPNLTKLSVLCTQDRLGECL